jgi:signal transduction histidine kinase
MTLWQAERREDAQSALSGATEIFNRLGSTYDRDQADKARQWFERADTTRDATRGQALADFHRLVGNLLDLDLLLQKLAQVAQDITGAERGYVLVYEGSRPVAKAMAAVRAQAPPVDLEHAAFSRTICHEVLRTRQSLCVTNLERDPRFATQQSVLAQGLRSALAAPMMVRGRPVGVIYVDSSFPSAELLGAQAPLEGLAAHAAVAIENAQLYEEQKARTHVLRLVAHELNNPLLAAVRHVRLAKSDGSSLPSTALAHLDVAEEQLSRLSRLVQNMLELARAGHPSAYRMAPVRAEELAQRVAAAMQPLLAIQAVAIHVECEAGLPAVLGDADRLEQVLTNLVSNALQYASSGGRVVVRARLAAVEPKGGLAEPELGPEVALPGAPELHAWEASISRQHEVELLVEDFGPGIPESAKEAIFEPYQLWDRGPRSGQAHLGLGLSICKEIVRRHGGNIRAENKPSGGCLFAFNLRSLSVPS